MKPISKTGNSALGIAAVFLVIGVFSLVISVLYELQILAFIGLGLTFWGAILSLARKGKSVEGSLLDSTAKPIYSTIDRMINDLTYTAKGFYIPSYPQEAYLPEYLKNLKEPVVFISEDFTRNPSIEELVAGKFFSEKSRGVFITSPGSDLMAQMEKQLQLDFSKITLQELCGVLPRCTTEIFNLAKSLSMTVLENSAILKASGILYESLYRPENISRSVTILGCPVVSAVACALAKTSGKTVVIQKQTFSPSNFGVEVTFNFL